MCYLTGNHDFQDKHSISEQTQEWRSILDTSISYSKFNHLLQMFTWSSTWVAEAQTKETLAEHSPTHSAEEGMIKNISHRWCNSPAVLDTLGKCQIQPRVDKKARIDKYSMTSKSMPKEEFEMNKIEEVWERWYQNNPIWLSILGVQGTPCSCLKRLSPSIHAALLS